MKNTKLEKAVNDFSQALLALLQAACGNPTMPEAKKERHPEEAPDNPAMYKAKEKHITPEVKKEPHLEEPSGITFKEVSGAYFGLLDRMAEEVSLEKAQSTAVKLVNKHCGGEPISKDTLKPENFQPLLADINKCNAVMDGLKNGK